MKLLTFAIAFTSIVFTSCQYTVTINDVQLRNDGLIYLANSSNAFSGTVENKDGLGVIEYQQEYDSGLKDGKFIYYHKNGQKKSQGNYVDGKYDGHWIWWDAQGNITKQQHYIKGFYKSTGKFILNTERLSKSEGEAYIKGTSTRFSGTEMTYYPNGSIAYQGEYINGKKQGRHIYCQKDNNTPNRITDYSNGILNGEFKEYNTINNYLIFSANYKKGELDGKVIKLNSEGNKIEYKAFFNNGHRIYAHFFNETGHRVSDLDSQNYSLLIPSDF